MSQNTSNNINKLNAITAGMFIFLFSNVVSAAQNEVIVIAQKRPESVKDIPIAITAFNDESMKQLGINDVSDLVSLTPGLSERKQSGSNTSYFLRGVGTNDVHLTAAPSVGQYLDEVTLTSGFQAKTALFDMERVEILKGPQNALFGLNTTGGTVSYYSKKPEVDNGTQGYIESRFGNLSLANIEGAVGFELGESAAARIAAFSSRSDGAFKSVFDGRDFGDDDSNGMRVQILWEMTEETKILMNVHYAQSENNGSAYKVLGTRAADGSGDVCSSFNPQAVPNFDSNTNCLGVPPSPIGDLGPGAAAVDPSFEDWEDVGMNAGMEDLETKGAFFNISHEFENVSFVSITSFDNLVVQNANDLDGTQLGNMMVLQEDDRDIFQQELRLLSTSDGNFRWIAGLYYLDQDSKSYTALRSRLIGGWAILPNVQLDHTKKNFSVYGQVEYDFSDALTMTVGLRWSDEKMHGDYLPSSPRVVGISDSALLFSDEVNVLVGQQNTGAAGLDANGFVIARQVTQDLNNKDIGFTVKLDYHLADDSLVYASFSRGFKGSALDIRPVYALLPLANVLTGLEDSRLEPESLDSWEFGYKTSLWNDLVRLDTSVFQYTYENLQQFISSRGIPTLDNAPESEILGFDTNIKIVNDSGFYAQIGISFLDSEITDSTGSTFVVGAPLAGAPEWSSTVLVSQEFELGDNLLTVMANLSYSADYASETLTEALVPVEGAFTSAGYTLFNANITYRFGSEGQFKVGVYGNNLTDEHYCHGNRASDTNNLAVAGNAGRHHAGLTCMVSNNSVRTYGVNFGYEF